MTTGQTVQLKEKFLAAFAKTGIISRACKAAGLPRRATVYEWQEHDDAFAAAFRAAELESIEVLEAEVFRRAVRGVTKKKGVYYLGRRIAVESVTEYSDTLLMFSLKARAPEKYRDNLPAPDDRRMMTLDQAREVLEIVPSDGD